MTEPSRSSRSSRLNTRGRTRSGRSAGGSSYTNPSGQPDPDSDLKEMAFHSKDSRDLIRRLSDEQFERMMRSIGSVVGVPPERKRVLVATANLVRCVREHQNEVAALFELTESMCVELGWWCPLCHNGPITSSLSFGFIECKNGCRIPTEWVEEEED